MEKNTLHVYHGSVKLELAGCIKFSIWNAFYDCNCAARQTHTAEVRPSFLSVIT